MIVGVRADREFKVLRDWNESRIHFISLKESFQWQSLFTGLDYWIGILDSPLTPKIAHKRLNLGFYTLVGRVLLNAVSSLTYFSTSNAGTYA